MHAKNNNYVKAIIKVVHISRSDLSTPLTAA